MSGEVAQARESLRGHTPPTLAEARIQREMAEATWRGLEESDARTAPLSPSEIEADPVAALLIPPTLDRPTCRVERLGPSYKIHVRPLRALFTFRDVRVGGELAADVSVAFQGRHLFRTTATLSLIGREKIAKVAAELTKEATPDAWKRATFAAVEEVLAAEEHLGAAVDLRTATLELPAGGTHIARPIWPNGSMVLVSPGDAGKSTIARAIAVSLASGTTVIPGIEPIGSTRPVLYVAAEDPIAYWHSRSIEAICRGASLRRADLAQPIELFDARGRPLHRIERALAERAADFGAIILDSQQALLGQTDGSVGIRDRDTGFWATIDALERPTFLIAHPNRSDARGWDKADGRIAGSEVNRDRSRMAWRATWHDEPAIIGTSYRRYSLENTKNSHGPREAILTFGASWTFGADDDPGMLTFARAEDMEPVRDLSPELRAMFDVWSEGGRSHSQMAEHLGIPLGTVKSRLDALKRQGFLRD